MPRTYNILTNRFRKKKLNTRVFIRKRLRRIPGKLFSRRRFLRKLSFRKQLLCGKKSNFVPRKADNATTLYIRRAFDVVYSQRIFREPPPSCICGDAVDNAGPFYFPSGTLLYILSADDKLMSAASVPRSRR